MKASKFSDAQKAFILKQSDDGVPVAEICRKAGDALDLRQDHRTELAGADQRHTNGTAIGRAQGKKRIKVHRQVLS